MTTDSLYEEPASPSITLAELEELMGEDLSEILDAPDFFLPSPNA